MKETWSQNFLLHCSHHQAVCTKNVTGPNSLIEAVDFSVREFPLIAWVPACSQSIAQHVCQQACLFPIS